MLTLLKRKKKTIFICIVAMAALVLSSIIYCDWRVRAAAEGKTFSTIDDVHYNHVGLLLGTGKYTRGGRLNPYYQYRIEATIALMKAGKIDCLIISGDNSRKDYSEPESMRADLIMAGIDSTRIYLDYAGFRTFDSMVRLREIFSQTNITIISQGFHNERALYIAQREGINAIGFNAQDVPASADLKIKLREKLARVKVFADYLFNTQPKFLGPKVAISCSEL
ncbi:MAG: ElyC/SanA/YdcF family protein [Bacteroidota bacterium]